MKSQKIEEASRALQTAVEKVPLSIALDYTGNCLPCIGDDGHDNTQKVTSQEEEYGWIRELESPRTELWFRYVAPEEVA